MAVTTFTARILGQKSLDDLKSVVDRISASAPQVNPAYSDLCIEVGDLATVVFGHRGADGIFWLQNNQSIRMNNLDEQALHGDGKEVRLYVALLITYADDIFAKISLKTTLPNAALFEAWAIAENATPGLKRPVWVPAVDINEITIIPPADSDFRA